MYDKSQIITNGSDLIGWSASNHYVYASLPSALKNKTYNVNDLPGITIDLVESAVSEKTPYEYITSVNKTELIKLVDQFVQSVKNQLNAKEILKNGKVITRRSDFSTKILDADRFYGYVITPQDKAGIKISISGIGFYPETSISGLPIYVFKASEEEYQEVITYNQTTAKTLDWQDVDVTISEQSYIGYFQSNLSTNLYTDAIYPCPGVEKFVSITPCTFESGQLNGTDRPNNIALNIQQYHPGFNLKINAVCDITDILLDNLDMFARPLQYAVAVRILSDALSTTELNNKSMAEKFREQWDQLRIKYNGELLGGVLENGTAVKGMIDRLALDFSDLDPACLPPKNEYVIGGRML